MQVNEVVMFNIQIPIEVAKRILGPDFIDVPERERVNVDDHYYVGKFGNYISILGSSFYFRRASFWNDTKTNLEVVNMDEGTDTWDIDYMERFNLWKLITKIMTII